MMPDYSDKGTYIIESDTVMMLGIVGRSGSEAGEGSEDESGSYHSESLLLGWFHWTPKRVVNLVMPFRLGFALLIYHSADGFINVLTYSRNI
jgi:hypothetical protein